MFFAIDPGHGNVNGTLGGDGGAVGDLIEQNCNLDIAYRVIAKLQALGHKCLNVRPTSASSVGNSLWKRVVAADSAGVDYFVSIHFNAGGGHGSEVWYNSQAGYKLGKPVLDQLVALGFNNRGMKNCTAEGERLYVVMNPKAPSILIEVCFVDSTSDANAYDAEKVANAIVKGLVGQTSSTTSNTSVNIHNSNNFSVSTNSLKTIQHNLNVLKIRDNSGKALVEDGISGPATVGAISNFQYFLGLTTDGVYGPQTESAMREILSTPLCGVPYIHRFATRYIQLQLGITITGVYDSATKKAVVAWQSKVGLVADGLFGPKSWGVILK